MLLCVDVCENCLETADFYCQDCRNAYCKMCSVIRHRQQSRSNHCVIRLSKLDVPVVSLFETKRTCITNSKSCTMKC